METPGGGTGHPAAVRYDGNYHPDATAAAGVSLDTAAGDRVVRVAAADCCSSAVPVRSVHDFPDVAGSASAGHLQCPCSSESRPPRTQRRGDAFFSARQWQFLLDSEQYFVALLQCAKAVREEARSRCPSRTMAAATPSADARGSRV